MTKTKRAIITIFIFIIIAFIVLLFLQRFDEIDKTPETIKVEYELPTVAVVRVNRGSIRQWISAEGTVRALRKEYLSFETAGKVVFVGNDITNRPIKEGSKVLGTSHGDGKGQLLARLDDRSQVQMLKIREAELNAAQQGLQNAREAVSQSKIRLDLRKKQFERSEKLFQNKLVTKAEFEEYKVNLSDAESALSMAQVELSTAEEQIKILIQQKNLAELDVEHTRIFAPFDGVISYLNIKPGDFVSPELIDRSNEQAFLSTSPIVIMSENPFEVLLHIPSIESELIKPNQSAVITAFNNKQTQDTSSNPGKNQTDALNAVVYSVNPSINSGDRTSRVRLRTTLREKGLKDGMYVKCYILTQEKRNVLQVPIMSLLFSEKESVVFTVDRETGITHKTHVKTGIEGLYSVEIVEGLNESDLLIIKGQKRLTDGEKVKILNHQISD
ncbi:efflux RND transporter periplasmic adaptor subunit [bacterium]|nr:efflux RND transporter periplasmic adaptor subunit [bacterium]